MTLTLINAFSLDASVKEINYHLIKSEQLENILSSHQKANNLEKISIILSKDQAELLKGQRVEKIIIEEKTFKSFLDLQKDTSPLNLASLYNQLGTETLVSVKGMVKKPGIYPSTAETPLLELIYGQAGGLKKMLRSLKAVLLGGSFGALLNQKALAQTLTQSTTSPYGPINNSLIVIDDTSCIVNLVKNLILYNYQKLSICSACGFCQKELAQAKDILENITRGQGTKETLEQLSLLIEEKDTKAMCIWGKQALLPLETGLKSFGPEFSEHVTDKYCQASVCEHLFLAPCSNACPAGVDFPGTTGLMQKGLFIEAVALGRESNPFFLTCGRICEEPRCEKHCQRQTIDGFVNSPALHRYAGEKAAQKAGGLDKALNHPSLKPMSVTNKKIAVVGAGPAGLTAAYFLARLGYKVTIFEKLAVPGGMLRIGIPDYRLPPELLNAEINHILSLDIEIKYNTELGKDFSLQDLQEGFDAVYLAIGAHKSNNMGITGEDLPGVLSGIEFLRKVNLGEKIEIGQKVMVVGGGNVAIDAARSAIRLGAKETKIVYRRSLNDMPAAFQEIRAAQEEGIKILPMTNPLEITISNGQKIVKTEKMVPGAFDNSGRRRPEKSQEFQNIEVDTVIMAIGQSPQSEYLNTVGIDTKWDQVQVEPNSFKTNIQGVFAGGDCVLGPATAVEGVGHGRKAALAIHKYLLPEDQTTFPTLRTLLKNFVGPYSSERIPQQQPQKLAVGERIRDFREVENPYTDGQAEQEMRRCICSAKTGL